MSDEIPETCPACGSEQLSWQAGTHVPQSIPGVLLFNLSEAVPHFALGCDECSETVCMLDADKIAEAFNDARARGHAAMMDDLHYELYAAWVGAEHRLTRQLVQLLDAAKMDPARDWDDLVNAVRCMRRQSRGGRELAP